MQAPENEVLFIDGALQNFEIKAGTCYMKIIHKP